jgi:short-subunit dehydrogenase
MAQAALDHFGHEIDVVINNAGASLIGAQSDIGDDAAARTVYEVNFWTPLALTAALVPRMLAAESGTIVNVTSTIQSVPLPLLGGYYGSSKSALAQATRALRLELAETPIRVIEVVPGATDTALRDIDELPWKAAPPKTFPPVSPDSSAAAIVRGIKRGSQRIVYPTYSTIPLEVPALGRLVARIGGRRVDTRGAIASRQAEESSRTS